MAKSKDEKKGASTRRSARIIEKKKRRQQRIRPKKRHSTSYESDEDASAVDSPSEESEYSSSSSESSSESSSNESSSSESDEECRTSRRKCRKRGRNKTGDKTGDKKDGANYLQKLMVMSLLQECASLKKKRAMKRRIIDTSSDESDDGSKKKGYVILNYDNCSDSDSDSDYTAPPHTKRSRKRMSAKHSIRAAKKALGKLRGGTLTSREERFLSQQSPEKCVRIAQRAMAVTRRKRRDVPLAIRVLGWDVPERTKALICERITRLEGMEPGEGEYAKLATWVSELEALPIGKLSKLPVSTTNDTPTKVAEFLTESRKTLDSAVFGHANLKDEVTRLLAQWIRNPDAPTQTLAIQGPPGNGKTTLVKDGLAKVMGRPFVFIALGGCGDASFIHGHDYTWEGSRPGRIADGLKTSGVMNPVFFFDELDKLSDTARGREIQQTLVHLLDGTQNNHFNDRFFAGIPLDMSKAVFVVSFNDPTKVDSVLLDRMRIVRTTGFPVNDKVKIAQQFLLPAIMKEIGLKPGKVTFEDAAIQHIVREYTNHEKGVRSLRRCIHHICSEMNLQWLLNNTTPDKEVTIITTSDVEQHLSSLRSSLNTSNSMYL